MSNIMSKLTAALLAVLLLYYFPMMQNAKRQEDVAQLDAYRLIYQFVDSVRNKGYLTPEMYNDFNRQLGVVLDSYDLELEHRHKVYVPEYGDPANASTFMGTYTIHEEAHFNSEVLGQLFPVDSPNKKMEERTYYLSDGDLFQVEVKNRGIQPSTILGRMLYGEWYSSSNAPLEYGGMVLNEDY